MHEVFRKIAHKASHLLGSPWAFILALSAVIVWALSGYFFNYSTTWQLIINTGTTILTFLMVFLIQNTQNRDAQALHLKLDELIKVIKPARDELIEIEEDADETIDKLEKEFKGLRSAEKVGDATMPPHKMRAYKGRI
jgi:low affinity Fe/Cu permease